MKVGDLVQTAGNGAGIGDTWTRPGTMCIITSVKKVDVNPTIKNLPPVKNTMVTVVIPSLGVTRTFHKAGLEMVSESR